MKNKRRSMLGAIGAVLLSMGLIGVFLYIALIVFLIGMSVYGLVLAFSASIILGILALIVEPSPLLFGLAMFFWDKNLPQMIVDFLNQ